MFNFSIVCTLLHGFVSQVWLSWRVWCSGWRWRWVAWSPCQALEAALERLLGEVMIKSHHSLIMNNMSGECVYIPKLSQKGAFGQLLQKQVKLVHVTSGLPCHLVQLLLNQTKITNPLAPDLPSGNKA